MACFQIWAAPGTFARHDNYDETFKGSSQDAVVGKRILFSHDIVSNLTAWKIKRTGLEEKKEELSWLG
jgi:hypothetical protein